MKFRRKGVIALTVALCMAVSAQSAFADAPAGNYSELTSAISNANDGDTITITEDIIATGGYAINKSLTIDLGGFTITRNADIANSGTPVFLINGGNVTIQNGTIISNNTNATGESQGVHVRGNTTAGGDPTTASVTLTDINITSHSENSGRGFGVAVYGNCAEFIFNSGRIEGDLWGISGNGTNDGTNYFGGTVITINGGEIIGNNATGIYHPQAGTLTVNGGSIIGTDGIQMKSGTLVVNGGTITGKGTDMKDIDQGGGSNETGAAISIISQGGATGSYAGNISVTINNGTLVSEKEIALYEAQATGAEMKFEELTISGGSISGAEDKPVMSMTNATAENTVITGGTFSSDPNTCPGMGKANIAEGTFDADGNYVIGSPSTPQHSGGGGGGCSAGFGALALLAVVPLLRMRKK